MYLITATHAHKAKIISNVFGRNQKRISPIVSKKSYRDYVGTKIRKSFLPFLTENIEMSIHAFFCKKSGKALETTEFLLVTLERMFLIVVTKIVSKRMIS